MYSQSGYGGTCEIRPALAGLQTRKNKQKKLPFRKFLLTTELISIAWLYSQSGYGGTCEIRTHEPRFCRPVYWTTLARCQICEEQYTNFLEKCKTKSLVWNKQDILYNLVNKNLNKRIVDLSFFYVYEKQ